MRDAIFLGNELWMGVDNSAGIGEKPGDVLSASESLVAEMAARVALLELWCVEAEAQQIVVINFTGNAAWNFYKLGIERLFQNIGLDCPPIAGSTESNMTTLQSGISVQIIGSRQKKCWYQTKKKLTPVEQPGNWFLIGKPLVGQAVLNTPTEVVALKELYLARLSDSISYCHPCGSSGVDAELSRLGIRASNPIPPGSAGPSTCVLVKSPLSLDALQRLFTASVLEI